ncbi:MAG TPA: hypothetical protein VLV25_07590 [Steroidobacteraceae bacterium]|nr:hypothetical protein [Steroidobacteraceae bacterium]
MISRVTRILVLAVCAVLGVMPQAQAGTARADIQVSVTVMARTLIDSESSPRQLEVSAADVARGYVEVQGATSLLVTNTNRRGYVLSVWPQLQVFSTVVVRSGDSQAELGADGGEIFERRWGKMLPLPLDFRFTLAPGVKPGVYPWPLRFQVSSLTF